MKCLLALILAFSAIWVGQPARATDNQSIDRHAPRTKEIRGPGFVEVTTAGDFQLIQHGNWTRGEPNPGNAILSSRFLQGYKSRVTKSEFRRATYLPSVQAAEVRYGLPRGLLDALVWTESRYNPFAVSTAGAIGLGQLMPKTALELGVSNRYDPVLNIEGAARYLRQLIDQFGMVRLALAAYNAGPHAVQSAHRVPRNRETTTYVRTVLERWKP